VAVKSTPFSTMKTVGMRA